VLIKVPKTLAMLEYQLLRLREVVTPETRIIAAGKVKEIHNSTLGLFEQILGTTKTSLAWKKARLIYSQVEDRPVIANPYPTVWPLDNTIIRSPTMPMFSPVPVWILAHVSYWKTCRDKNAA
jgi:16S rRNA m(2)G 1207 methyltransferase (EC 2.1.1.52)/23S rRNA m(2)G-1835 methyltransferase (EC 2.1.1.52)